ncbi:metallophosphoesterase [Agrobacterium vitis]|uniref:Metallophosphoesterase n=1 Tax=Agrobacterium vitis TaxID=373 RepID=A0AAE5AV01_AGRVI|nr:metallophosphoesterase [Agrobacterium vitis]MCF1497439.1 metallophosphoesterase [Allorhizobium sp. Av2]MCM2438865.1 metallophosphoesterase [Agrobacterium vitis]MUZ56856.1 metallophosphoesterase [Agrobacterium vitis]MVA64991.1 metallophosphoesterase [Agrobacterium vitis]MVA86007.1 metallophosphoesterase [Agrobacterium vitis]
MQIAVVADVHLHDLYGGYGMVEEGGGLALRTLADTMASTRVFNESHAAFRAVLDDIVRRGIRDVVLLGDYSDDGQVDAVAAVKRLLSDYEDRHGLRFFATFGNHDCYGLAPRHLAKLLTQADGLEPLMVTSDDRALAPAIVCPGMRGMSVAEAVAAMAPYGITRPETILHWETPHDGLKDVAPRHLPTGHHLNCDASYLVEPQEGLWLLMLDANVFHKIGDIWQVRADAAWDHVLAERPYLLAWIKDVTERANRLAKTLLAFSHYPALPLALTGEGNDVRAASTPDWSKRMPSPESGRCLARAGLRWHFSGHMHVVGRVELDGLVNIAVPSPVAYPGGYVVVTAGEKQIDIEIASLEEVADFDAAFPAYDVQSGDKNSPCFAKVLACKTYAEFLRVHLQNLIETKHSPDDWPPELLACLDVPIGRLFREDAGLAGLPVGHSEVMSEPFCQMVEDYYLLRAAGRHALGDIPAERVVFYRDLAKHLRSQEHVGTGMSGEVANFLELFAACTHFDGWLDD